MLADPGRILQDIVLRCWPDRTPDARALAFAVSETASPRLQAQEDAHSFVERPPAARRFFRSGRAGDGVDRPSPAFRARLWDAHGDMMRRIGDGEDGRTRPA